MTTKEALESSTAQPTKKDLTAPAVLITGALTGIGRATALAFAREGARIVASGRHDDKGKAYSLNSKNSALKPRSSNPTFAMRMKFALWSMKQ
jgi:short chain dehydrogenase